MFENKNTKQINEGTKMIQENNNNKTKEFIFMKREKKTNNHRGKITN